MFSDNYKNKSQTYYDQVENKHGDILITRRLTEDFLRNRGLKKVLNLKDLWLLGVGIVISGFFCQWNLALGLAGPLGMLTAMVIVAFLYLLFILVMAKLSALLPYAGGPYAYARLALGRFGGYLAGTLTIMEFVFAAAASIKLVKKYLVFIYPDPSAVFLTFLIVILVFAFHFFDIRLASFINFIITSFALSVLILFFIATSNSINTSNLISQPPFPFGWQGILQALPYVIWLFIGLEGISVAAEETKISETALPTAFITGAAVVIILSFAVWFFAVASINWGILVTSDFPLVTVLNLVQSQDKVLLATVSSLGLSGFIASLNGLIYGYSRQIYALSRAGYLPLCFSRLHHKRQTPFFAVVLPGLFCILLAFLLPLSLLIKITIFSAVSMYLLVMISYFKIRKYESDLFLLQKVPYHPYLIGFGIILQIIILITFFYYNYGAALIVFVIELLATLYYLIWGRYKIQEEAPEESKAVYVENKLRIDFH